MEDCVVSPTHENAGQAKYGDKKTGHDLCFARDLTSVEIPEDCFYILLFSSCLSASQNLVFTPHEKGSSHDYNYI